MSSSIDYYFWKGHDEEETVDLRFDSKFIYH